MKYRHRKKGALPPPDGAPIVQPDPSDRYTDEVSYDLTPAKIDGIMAAANSGDIADQVKLAQEILEKNADIIQAFSTRKDAVTGLPWHIEPGQDEKSRRAAEVLEEALRNCGGDDDADTFEEMLEDMLGAILPGFAVSEILWEPGGSFRGFHHIPQRFFTFSGSLTPLLLTEDHPEGISIPRGRIIYHKRRFHGSDPVRGGLIRPLAWLHCFKHVGEKDLLSFIERHGMPFIAAKVDPSSFEKEKNLIKRLVRNFGSSGGGVFTRAVELQLLECHNTGEAYFRLLEYLESAVNKVLLGQTASSGDSSGWSKGDAQSKVRQDILEADCRQLMRLVDTQLVKPWMRYNFGETGDLPRFIIDCAPPEDKEKIAGVVKTLHEAGFECDADEVGKRVGLKLTRAGQPAAASDRSDRSDASDTLNLKQKYDAMGVAIRAGLLTATPEIEAQTRAELGLPAMSPEVRKAWAATGGIRQPITLKSAESEAVSDALDVDEAPMSGEPVKKKDDPPPAELTAWLGPVAEELSDLSDRSDLSDKEFAQGLKRLASGAALGDSTAFERTAAGMMAKSYEEGARHGDQGQS